MNNLNKFADVIILPCKLGTKLYRVTYPYRNCPKVTEYTVVNFRTVGKKHKIMLEVRVNGVSGTNIMAYDRFYTTYEEAEKELVLREIGRGNRSLPFGIIRSTGRIPEQEAERLHAGI